jgi:hypothetical protein
VRDTPATAGDAAWRLFIAAIYLGATGLALWYYHAVPDRLMTLATQIAAGRLDSPAFAGTVDSVESAGRFYLAVGPLQPLPYLPFTTAPALQPYAGYIIGAGLGILAAWLCLPLVRAYGARESARPIATFAALGTLLFYVSVFGDLYYLAHVQAFLALTLLLIEWAGPRRPFVIGVLLGVAFLARAPTALAAIPFGLALIWRHPGWFRRSAAFAAPLLGALAVYGAYNLARFGSPTEAGYGLSLLTDPALESRRDQGVFAVAHVVENLRLALLASPKLIPTLPFIEADPYGQSMLIVSPALLLAIRAGFRSPLALTLWVAATVVAIPVFLYYGGGFVQYGFRYSLDFTPFLLALVALGARGRLGGIDRALIAFSIASVTYGVIWHVRGGPG